ncbi:Crp/Fnr family transcriptional regulator [Streptomyces avicenniae]|uniref:Crp/Fnr family transcriptional regulator n=1 Tax=Streptomyces avicenniae TaxID=500153 RepID=UPI001CBA6883|nr:Crp/Fnr family transcriptional regulator [Streptomyces avicenniae]
MTEGASRKHGPTLRDFVGDLIWSELTSDAYSRSHPPGTILLRQGEKGTHLLALLDGVAKVVRTGRSGESTLLAFRGPGELLGEVAVLDGGERGATVETLTRCTVVVVKADDFLRFATQRDIFPALVRYAFGRLRESDRARGTGNALARLADTLVSLAHMSGHPPPGAPAPLDLALTRDELAQYLGTSRNTITAKLAELESCHVETAGRRHIVINDLSALRRTAALLRR